jgi:microcystin degradation protein MlrC
VLTERPTSQIHPQYFRAVGIDPRAKRIVVVQSAHLFRDAFEVEERIPRMVIEVDTPGITSPDVHRFTYRKVRRPIFPLDDCEWQH